jgi:hypothetical protein
VSFATTSTFVPQVQVRTDPPTPNIVIQPASGATAEWLLPAGTYQFRVAAPGATGGPVAIAANAVPANSGCKPRFLIAAGSFTGQALNTNDCLLQDDSRYDVYVISTTRPCGFTLRTSAFTPFLWIFNFRTGVLLDGRTGDPGTDVSFGSGVCGGTGDPLMIWVNSDSGEPGGAYTFTITVVAPATLHAFSSDAVPARSSGAPRIDALLERKEAMRKRGGRQ